MKQIQGVTLVIHFLCCYNILDCEQNIPIVITTWSFTNSTSRAWEVLERGGLALDAIEQGASVCEYQQCDGTVGYGGSPDENGETTLDALIMDGRTMNVGAVGALRRIKSAISVARHVLDYTKHSFLVGELATQFAVSMGFKEESLTTVESKRLWKKWHNKDSCQPNFWINVKPDPTQHCGPYTQRESHSRQTENTARIQVDRFNHDTIGMVAIDNNADIAAGTSTNGAKYKIPGRIGDSPIPGSGAYADNAVGGASATGDGDVMLRFLPSFLAVEEMRKGASPEQAANTAIRRITEHYPSFMGAVITLTKDGRHGASCHGIEKFPYVVQDKTQNKYRVITIGCTKENV